MVDYKGYIDEQESLTPSFTESPQSVFKEDPTIAASEPDNSVTENASDTSIYSKRPRNRNMAAWVAVIMVAAILTGTMSGVGYYWAGTLYDNPQDARAFYLEASAIKQVKADYGMSESIPDMVDRLGDAVVSITSQVVQNDFYFNQFESSGSGTGVVFNINKDAVLIVTNNHVIEGSSSLSVSFNRNTSAKATIVGSDPDSDIAVIKVLRKDLPQEVVAKMPTVIFGNSDKIRVGELSIAIGNPLGYDDTVTVGVVSGIDRSLTLDGRNFNLIQTDAAINPGNSGGALFNGKGEVIGINTVKISDQEVEGIGFAIPINTVKPLIQEILTKGYVSKPYLGIAGQDITQEVSDTYNLPLGIMITEVVQGSGADKAGLVAGEVILKADGKVVDSMEDLISIIKAKKVGDSITLVVKGEKTPERTVKAVLGDKNNR